MSKKANQLSVRGLITRTRSQQNTVITETRGMEGQYHTELQYGEQLIMEKYDSSHWKAPGLMLSF